MIDSSSHELRSLVRSHSPRELSTTRGRCFTDARSPLSVVYKRSVSRSTISYQSERGVVGAKESHDTARYESNSWRAANEGVLAEFAMFYARRSEAVRALALASGSQENWHNCIFKLKCNFKCSSLKIIF